MKKILFVCLGNICRSPLAEALLQHKVNALGLQNNFDISSAGTSGLHEGENPDSRTIKNAASHGVILRHKGRKFSKEDFLKYDLIVAMDDSNVKNILQLDVDNVFHSKVYKLRNWDSAKSKADVPDPWYGDEQGFETVFQLIDESTENLLQEIIGI